VRAINHEKFFIFFFKDITELFNLHDQLKEKERFLRRTNIEAKIGGWEYDVESKQLVWSDITKDIHEVDVNFEPNVETAIQFYKEGESRNTITKCFTELLETGKPYSISLQINTAKHHTIWVRANGSAQFRNGKIIKVFGTFQNIQAEKEEEFRRLMHEMQYRSLFDYNPQAVISINEKGELLAWNKSFEKLICSTEDKIAHKTVFDFIPGKEVEDIKVKLFNSVSNHSNINQLNILTTNGEIKIAVCTKIPIKINDNLVGIYLVLEEVTNEVLAEQKLAESEDKLRAYFNSSSDAICLLNKNMEITAFNAVFEKSVTAFFNRNPLIGESILNLAAKGTEQDFIAHFNKALNGEKVSIERPITFGNHTNWWLVHYLPIYDKQSNVKGVAFTSADITKRKLAELEVMEKNEELAQIYNTVNDVIFKIRVEAGLLR